VIRIVELIDPECVVLEIQSTRQRNAVRELADALQRRGKIDNASILTEEVLEREKLAATAIGQGIALPHRLTAQASETVLAFGRSRRGVKFDTPDGVPVRLLFLTVGPPESHTDHLRLLSRLSRLLCKEEFLMELERAKSPEEIVELFRREEQEGSETG
jgi:fructose PTS system EIIBC or EIIC component